MGEKSPLTRTKIICTIGPSTSSPEMLEKLIHAGMNVARINFSHSIHSEHKEVIERIKVVRKKLGVPLAILLDTKGPEIRIGDLREAIALSKGDALKLVKEGEGVSIDPPFVLDALEIGATVLFDDGYMSSKVIEKTDESVTVRLDNGGMLKARKGVNIPGVDIDLPAMTEQDVKDITFGCAQGVDIIAASFIRSAEHIHEIKQLLCKCGKPDIPIVAKIENSLGIKNFDEIVQAADGIMVARGDLGVELPLSEVPKLQKEIIRKCIHAAKPVVTATQMLESMISAPRPTRAEVSDVANAIYDSTSAVMLSGETAVGAYPLETVEMMKGIIAESERDFDYTSFFHDHSRLRFNDISSSIALAAVKTAYSLDSKSVIAFTRSGFTARALSRFRPAMGVIALTDDENIYHRLAFIWGVSPLLIKRDTSLEEGVEAASDYGLSQGFFEAGDSVVITGGAPLERGTTNLMMVESIGDVLVRGEKLGSEQPLAHGRVVKIESLEEAPEKLTTGTIAVIPRFTEEFESLLNEVSGIVLQNHPDDHESVMKARKYAEKREIALISRADGALSLLKEGQNITLDPQRGLIFKNI